MKTKSNLPSFRRLLAALLLLFGNSHPIAAQPACVPPPSGLVSWWRGEGSANDVNGINSPTETFGAPQFVAGEVGLGIKLDGGSGFAVSDRNSLDFDASSSFAFAGWVRIDGVPANASVLVDKRQFGGGLGYSVGMLGTDAGSDARKFYFGLQDGAMTFSLQAVTPAATGIFHHLAAVVDRAGGLATLYVDGAEEASQNLSGLGSLANNGRFFLGHQSLDVFGTTGVPFDGMLDEVTLFNRALTAAEISAIFNAGSAGFCASQPLAIAPLMATVPTGRTVAFTASGGTSPYTFSIVNNPAYGTIDPGTGDYMAGNLPSTDTVQVKDAANAIATATVTVMLHGFTVSGRVTNLVSGANMDGLKVRLVYYEGSSRTFLQTLTDANGIYNFSGIPGGSLVSLFPENKTLVFSPPFKRVPSIASNLQFDFGASVPEVINENVVIAGIEVVQSVQDWKNSVPLVAGKDTYVRVNIRNPETSPNDRRVFTGKLRGYRNGGEFADSPLSALPPGYAATDGDLIARRKTFEGGTLNFHLPTEWRLAGTIDLQLEADPATPALCLDPAESGGQEHDCTIRVTFQEVSPLQLKVFPIIQRGTLSHTEIDIELAKLTAMFPIRAVDVQFGADYFAYNVRRSSKSFLFDLLGQLEKLRLLDSCGGRRCPRIYFGAVQEPDNGVAGIAPAGGGSVASGVLSAMEHELGHDLGIEHTYRRNGPCGNSICNFCGEYADGIYSPEFPYRALLNGREYPVLGPLSAERPEEMVFGLLTAPQPTLAPNMATVINPFSEFDLMSYCNEPNHGWASSFSYGYFMNEISRRFPPPDQFRASSTAKFGSPPASTLLLIGGQILLANNAAQLDPILPAFVPDPGPPPPGNYNVQLINQSGTVISETSFQPVRPIAEAPNAVSDVLTFNFLIPYVSNAVMAVIRSNNMVIGFATRSASAPLLTILSPVGGESFSSNMVNIAWTASDPDGDQLTFTVQYRPDNGATFTTLTTGETNQFLDIARDALQAGTNAVFRVIASDGFNNCVRESNPFSVANNGPLVFLHRPVNGSLFSGDNLIFFEATSYDVEDGSGLQSIVWSSSQDGALGAGTTLLRTALTLSEGIHVITATVSDSAGMTNSASATMEVVRYRRPQLETLGFDAAGRFGVRLIGDEGTRYLIQGSTNLQNWFPLKTNTMVSTLQDAWDSTSTNRTQLFFRATLTP